MSSALQPSPPPDLALLRGELDGIDDALHDLVMRRAAVVARIGALASKGPVKLRPGREAAIIRRLLARHAGPFPPVSLLLLWRQLLNGMTALQAPYALAVCDPDPAGGYTALAREHFGALTPLRCHGTAAQAIAEVGAGLAAAAVLPMPAATEAASDAWWTALLRQDGPRVHVTARLPFWAKRPAGASALTALVVSAAPPDPSGSDRSLLGLEMAAAQSRSQLGQAVQLAGFDGAVTVLRQDGHASPARALVDVAGFVTDDDPRCQALGASMGQPVVLGAYAIPLEGASP